MKKTLFLTTILSLALVPGFTKEPSKHTADYIKGLAPEYIDKKVSLDVSSVSLIPGKEHPEFGFLIATTYDTRNRVPGGRIILVADKEKSIDLVKRYGVKPDVDRGRRGIIDVDTLRLSGVLRETGNKTLFLDLASSDVPTDILKGLKDDLPATKVKTPVRRGPVVMPPKGKVIKKGQK